MNVTLCILTCLIHELTAVLFCRVKPPLVRGHKSVAILSFLVNSVKSFSRKILNVILVKLAALLVQRYSIGCCNGHVTFVVVEPVVIATILY